MENPQLTINFSIIKDADGIINVQTLAKLEGDMNLSMIACLYRSLTRLDHAQILFEIMEEIDRMDGAKSVIRFMDHLEKNQIIK